MKRIALPLVVAIGLLVVAPSAQASDASLRRALKPYTGRLTTDIAYLSNFTAPRKSRAAAVLGKLSKIRGDLSGATRAATTNLASTNSGRKGRTLVLSGLSDATVAAGDARASATAARSGNRSGARRSAKKERTLINKAITLLPEGGKLLHLF
jgi:hypothetical protein